MASSDKPAYCSDVSDLQQSVDDLKNVQLNSGAVSTLQTDLQKMQSNANAVVSSAKQDFPSQTSALESSVSSLSTAIKQLPASPTAQAAGLAGAGDQQHRDGCEEPLERHQLGVRLSPSGLSRQRLSQPGRSAGTLTTPNLGPGRGRQRPGPN